MARPFCILPRWLPLVVAVATGFSFGLPADALNVQRLEPAEVETLTGILKTLEPVLAVKKQDGTAILLAWDALYEPLTAGQRAFLDQFRALKAEALGATSHHFGEAPAEWDIVPVGPQHILKGGLPTPLDPQYLPRNVLEAYQLYLFMFYLPKHGYSITETNRFVALPGYSEHGYPPRQAIDFINAEGINGEDHPEEFEALPEYGWLQQHANEYGFFLSYPRNNATNTSFEPWHWHYQGAR